MIAGRLHSINLGGAAVAAFVGVAAASGGRVEFADNRLKVDGKPFFPYGCWNTPNQDYAEFRRRHFNTAFMGIGAAAEHGPKAAAAGLMVMVYPSAVHWSETARRQVESVVDGDWVLAWNIGDDLATAEHLAAAVKTRDAIRTVDSQHRPVAFDAIGRYDDFARVADMWCAYAYPLVRPALDAHAGGKPAGLAEYGAWLEAKRLQGRPDGFFWTWAQCHVQVWYNVAYLGGKEEGQGAAAEVWRRSPFPDGDHLRLIAAQAVSAGVRGLMWFVHYYFQDDHTGRDRYARAAVIGCELDVVGPLIAQGRSGPRLATSDPDVQATPIDFPGGRLICLVRNGKLYHYQPDAAEARDVRVETGAAGRVYQIDAEMRELPEARCSFALTSWLLVTADAAVADRVRQAHQAVAPDMARFAVEELDARTAKVEPVLAELGEPPEAALAARARLASARTALDQQQWTRARAAAEDGLRVLRIAQHRVWSAAWTGAPTDAGLRMTDFYLLPRFARQLRALRAEAWGADRLGNGSFETDAAWAGGKLGHDPTGKAVCTEASAHTGRRSLRLRSEAPSLYRGETKDWVTVDVVSEKVPAGGGEIWQVSAWVRVPTRIEQTVRGVTVSLFAYAADGKPVPGYQAMDNEARQVEAATDWVRIRVAAALPRDTAFIAARAALCGVGEAYVDDVTVRRLDTTGR